MKQILIYSGIYDFTAEQFIRELAEVPEDEDITVRLNSPGGSVFAGWGMIAALKERTGRNILKIDGNASSMAFYMSLFFDEVIALDVTSLMVHRADGYVSNAEDQKALDNINLQLMDKLKSRINSQKFKDITGMSYKELFNSETRRNVWMTAKEAKKVGLVDKVVRLEPKEIRAIEKNLVAFANFENEIQGSIEITEVGESKVDDNDNNNNKKQRKMTIQELKSDHKELYAQAVTDGIKTEKGRVESWLVFSEIDFEAVKKGIENDEVLTPKVMAEMGLKSMAKSTLKDASAERIIEVETPETTAIESYADAELLAFEKKTFDAAGLKMEEN